MEERVFIAIGSNLGDREGNLREAVRLAGSGGGLSVVKVSSFYGSEPWGVPDQGEFVNAVMEVHTRLGPRELLRYIKGIESGMGRKPAARWGPRVIDLDMIFYGERVIKEEGLEVPHPRAHERAFVITPLAEIAPDVTHPVLKRTVSEISAGLGSPGLRRIRG